jgi:hypothetical protein
VWTDEDVVTEDNRMPRTFNGGRPEHRVLGDDRGLTDFDRGALGVEDRTVHDPDPRADADVSDKSGVRRDIRARVDARGRAPMVDQHAIQTMWQARVRDLDVCGGTGTHVPSPAG